MSNLTGKKLLVLGGQQPTFDVVKTAKKMGLKVYCVDLEETGCSKELSDKSYLISTNDYDTLLELINDEKIDGVFSGASEFNTENTIRLSKLAGLPCYCTIEQWNVLQNKRQFKDLCIEHNVPVVPEYSAEVSSEEIEYPVVIKPTDSCSSQGLSVCRSVSDYAECLDYALKYSKSKTVIIEKMMECENLITYYTVCDGKVSLSAAGDWYKYKNRYGLDSITSAIVFPSKYTDIYLKKINKNICKMITALGVKNGVLNLQMFVRDGEFYVYECCLRVSGTQEYNVIAPANGINNLEMMLECAVTGKMGDVSLLDNDDPYFNGKAACNLAIMLNEGKISEINGIKEVLELEAIKHMSAPLEVGDVIKSEVIGTLGQTFCRFHIVTDTKEDLRNAISFIYDNLKIFDENGNDMLSGRFNVSLI